MKWWTSLGQHSPCSFCQRVFPLKGGLQRHWLQKRKRTNQWQNWLLRFQTFQVHTRWQSRQGSQKTIQTLLPPLKPSNYIWPGWCWGYKVHILDSSDHSSILGWLEICLISNLQKLYRKNLMLLEGTAKAGFDVWWNHAYLDTAWECRSRWQYKLLQQRTLPGQMTRIQLLAKHLAALTSHPPHLQTFKEVKMIVF